MVGPFAKREAVAHLRNVLQISERRACILVAADRKMIRYRSRRPADVELRARLRDLANQRRRFGYRRLFITPPTVERQPAIRSLRRSKSIELQYRQSMTGPAILFLRNF